MIQELQGIGTDAISQEPPNWPVIASVGLTVEVLATAYALRDIALPVGIFPSGKRFMIPVCLVGASAAALVTTIEINGLGTLPRLMSVGNTLLGLACLFVCTKGLGQALNARRLKLLSADSPDPSGRSKDTDLGH